MQSELAAAGLAVHLQNYRYDVPSAQHGKASVNGTNVYARSHTPRIDGREALVLAASWLSRWKEAPRDDHELPFTAPDEPMQRAVNVRGIASLLALAHRLRRVPNWSKDIFFVVSDGHLDGMQAWATRYFGRAQSSLSADEVDEVGAQIWNALALDYPSDSFSSLSLAHEGMNGQLPNLDTLNGIDVVVRQLSTFTGVGLHGAPSEYAALYAPNIDDVAARGIPRKWLSWLETHVLGWGGVRNYAAGCAALAAQWRMLLAGHPSGIHGVLHPFHVDAVTLFAEPDTGPFGFFEMGRVSEGTVRMFSNLLERLHHSQFFYLLLSPRRFVQVGLYLGVPLLTAAVLTLTGLALWNALGRRRDEQRLHLIHALVWDRAGGEATDEAEQRSAAARDKRAAAEDAFERALGQLPLEAPTLDQLQVVLRSDEAVRRASIDAYVALGRPVWLTLTCMGAAHIAAFLCLAIAQHAPLQCVQAGLASCAPLVYVQGITLASPFLLATLAVACGGARAAGSMAACLHAFAMLHAGTIASVLALLNVAQATTMIAVLCVTLYPVSWAPILRSPSLAERQIRAVLYLFQALFLVAVAPTTLLFIAEAASARLSNSHSALGALYTTVNMALWDSHILRTVTLPFIFLAYLPPVLEGSCACLLYCIACMQP